MFTRRALLGGAAMGASAVVAARLGGPVQGVPPGILDVVTPDSPLYDRLASRGYNPRFRAAPQEILVPHDTSAVVRAVQRAVDSETRIGLRAGGHCFEGFADRPEVAALLDLGRLRAVGFDHAYRAFSVGAAADLGSVYQCLYRGWGVTVPGGTCLGVGAAGLISGGGFGGLSRRFGVAADHLYGVELVAVDASGQARAVVATRDGPNRDLWWAHTGGGGGNFGVITRFLMRSPVSDGSDPSTALPVPPRRMCVGRLHLVVPTVEAFVSFVGNFLSFLHDHRAPGAPATALYSTLYAGSLLSGGCSVQTYFGAEAQHVYDDFVAAMSRGVWPRPVPAQTSEGPFLPETLRYCTPRGRSAMSVKYKSAFLRTPYSNAQLRTLHRFLSDPSIVDGGSGIQFFALGGQIGAVAPGQTALAERRSIAKVQILGGWSDPRQSACRIRWTREFYRALYANTGGVPQPDRRNGGGYINYPDTDMADPEWNPALPWHHLYYQDNYPRLQEVKSAWDPQNRFSHPLGVTST